MEDAQNVLTVKFQNLQRGQTRAVMVSMDAEARYWRYWAAHFSVPVPKSPKSQLHLSGQVCEGKHARDDILCHKRLISLIASMNSPHTLAAST